MQFIEIFDERTTISTTTPTAARNVQNFSQESRAEIWWIWKDCRTDGTACRHPLVVEFVLSMRYYTLSNISSLQP